MVSKPHLTAGAEGPAKAKRRLVGLLILATTASLALAAATGLILATRSAPPPSAELAAPEDAADSQAPWFRCNGEFVTDGHTVGCFERMSPAGR